MDKSRFELKPGLWLDYRRAAFLEEHRVLCVADLHLGYAWAHRYGGQMLPVHAGESVADRLCELCEFYKPTSLAVLGDIVHHAVPVTAIAEEFSEMVRRVREKCGLHLILGNHDKKLRKLVSTELEFQDCLTLGDYLLVHGNKECAIPLGATVLMGHEHPAISLGDNVRSARFPCFLASESVVVLPAFSQWAAGSDIRAHRFMSALANNARFHIAIAVLGNKLLPVKL